MTIGEYSVYTGIYRQTLYKQYARDKSLLAGVIKDQKTHGGLTILTVDLHSIKKAKAIKPAKG